MQCKNEATVNDTHVAQSVVIPTAIGFILNSTNDVEGISLEKQVKPKDDLFFLLQFTLRGQ